MTAVTEATRTNHPPAPVQESSDSREAIDGSPFGKRTVVDDREYAVLLAAFEDDDAANTARDCLSHVGTHGATIKGVITLRTDACGVVHVRRLTDNSTRLGLAAGVVGGVAAGVLLSPPLLASIVGLGLAGGVAGKLRYEYRKAGTGAALLGALRPDTSALLAIVKAEDAEKTAGVLSGSSSLRTSYVDARTAAHLTEVARRIG